MSDGDGAEPGQQKVVKRKKKQVFEERADESTKAKDQKKDKFEEEGYWRLLLHNDDIHTFEYVTALLQDTVSTISDQKAHEMTITTHEAGVATITQTSKDLAKEYCETLQRAGLTASIAPDKDFEGERKDKPGEGGPSAS
ncbi:ATP-dependent Clp protease adaptor protein ClpS-domain-containing protein [Pelagophyceae sp. CCMP2097]|nr:ATP-dependent Clp protease adaptor protein ClpS-domain-containing protein [Pelagophyceae sp. CCMP2097]